MNNRLKISLLCFLVGSSVFNIKCSEPNAFEDSLNDPFKKKVYKEFKNKIDDAFSKFKNKKDEKLSKFENKIDDELSKFENKIDDELSKLKNKSSIGICFKLAFTKGLPYICGLTSVMGLGLFLNSLKK